MLSACLSMANLYIAPVLFLNSFECKAIFTSAVLSYGRMRLCAYCQKSVLRSDLVSNFEMSLFRTLNSPGSLITVVVGEARTTVLPGSNKSHKPPQWSRLDLLVIFLANFSSREVSVLRVGSESFW